MRSGDFAPEITLESLLSALTNKFRKNSDVDILVEFDRDHVPGLIGISGLEFELEEIIGRPVDLPKDLSPYFRNDVITQAYHLYGKKRFS